MNSTGLHNAFREDVRDTQSPYLWTSSEVYRYANDAQNMFCRLQGGIADASSPLTQISASATEPFGTVSSKLLKIRYAARVSDNFEVEILNFEDLQRAGTTDDYGYYARTGLDNTLGQVRSMIVGMESNKVRFVPIPDAAETISLIVYRMPLEDITGAGIDLEIDEQHHEHLLLWMKHRAYSKQDAETFDKGKAAEFETRFREYCRQAREEREKREHKHRAVVYGGY